MDEKVAEVANLTLRLREMSGKVMWHESHQEEVAAEIEGHKKRAVEAEQKLKEAELRGVRLADYAQKAGLTTKQEPSLSPQVIVSTCKFAETCPVHTIFKRIAVLSSLNQGGSLHVRGL